MSRLKFLSLAILIVLAPFITDRYLLGNQRFYAETLYTFDGDPIAPGVLVISDGVVVKTRGANILDKYNPFVEKTGTILPGLIDPYLRTDCSVVRVTEPKSTVSEWERSQRDYLHGIMAGDYEPWVSANDDLYAMNSLFINPRFISYLVARETASGVTTSVIYPPPSFYDPELEYYGRNPGNQTGIYSPGLNSEALAEIELKFKSGDQSKVFAIELTSNQIVTAYRLGLLTERTAVIVHEKIDGDALDVLRESGAGLLVTGSDTAIIGRELELEYPGIDVGIASGYACASPTMLELIKTLGIDGADAWRIASATNGKILHSERGTLKSGAPADFVALSTDTLILEGLSPEQIDFSYRDGRALLDHHRLSQFNVDVQTLRKELDELAASEGKYLGKARTLQISSIFNK